VSPASDWLEQLEARLEQQLEAFLRANPAQEALLEGQERAEQQQRQRQQLQQAAALRSELLQLAAEIRQWRERTQRAREAGAHDLAQRAEQQVAQLMERGRQRWQTLEQLGRAVQATPTSPPSAAAQPEPLDRAWAQFELEQELEALRRQQAQRS
jgi:hercynine metabolism protein